MVHSSSVCNLSRVNQALLRPIIPKDRALRLDLQLSDTSLCVSVGSWTGIDDRCRQKGIDNDYAMVRSGQCVTRKSCAVLKCSGGSHEYVQVCVCAKRSLVCRVLCCEAHCCLALWCWFGILMNYGLAKDRLESRVTLMVVWLCVSLLVARFVAQWSCMAEKNFNQTSVSLRLNRTSATCACRGFVCCWNLHC